MADQPDLDLNTVIPLLQGKQNADKAGAISDQQIALTHRVQQPTAPYMHPNVPKAAQVISDFYGGGLQRAMGLPNNPVGQVLQNEDNQAALGMAGPFPKGFYKIPISKESLQNSLKQGMTHQQIADAAGVDRSTITNRMGEYGLAKPYVPKVRLTPRIGPEAEIEARNKQQIAERNNPGKNLIQSKLQHYGVAKPTGPAMPLANLNLPPMPDISAKEMAEYLKIFGAQK